MTPIERSVCLKEGRPVDRLPCVPILANTVARVAGVKVSELRANGGILARATIEAYRRFGFDSVRIFTDLCMQPEAMGAKVTVREDETALMDAPAIENEKDIGRLIPHDPYRNGNLPVLLEAAKRTLEAIGKEVPVSCGVQGPFTLASFLAGPDRISRWMGQNPEHAHRVLEIACEADILFADAVIDSGAAPSVTCAESSSAIITPERFREFSKPYLARLITHIKSRGVDPVLLHICGQTAPIWQDMADTGAGRLSIDNSSPLAEAKRRVGHRVSLMGNIPPEDVLLRGTPAAVRAAARQCIREAWDNPCGFILASGCSLPTETPLANIDAMLDAAREVGWPVDPARLKEETDSD
jgi:uroporphyrinogen decarboxylase